MLFRSQIGRVKTDQSGNFEFLNLEPGKYELVVALNGYAEAREPVEISAPAMTTGDPNEADPDAQFTMPEASRTASVYILLNPIGSRGASDSPFVELASRYPKKAVQEYEKAIEDSRKGNTSRYVERLENLLKTVPDFAEVHNDLGVYYAGQKKFADAEGHFRKIRDLQPKSAAPLVRLGSLYLQQAEAEKNDALLGEILDNALDALEAAIVLDPAASAPFYLLGTAYFRSAFYEEAEDNFTKALNIDASMTSARLMLVNVYLRQEKWTTALDQLDRVLKDRKSTRLNSSH